MLFFYKLKCGIDVVESNKEFFNAHTKTSLGVEFSAAVADNTISIIGDFPSGLKVIDKIQAWIRKETSPFKPQWLSMCKLEAEELRNQMVKYFVEDMRLNLANEKAPFVFFFDTYEEFTKSLHESSSRVNDKWLKDKSEGFILRIPALFIFAGHNKFNWAEDEEKHVYYWKDPEFLEEHCLGSIGEQDSIDYLESIQITNLEHQQKIVAISKGIPHVLDLCGQYYHQQLFENGNIANISFAGSIKELCELIVGGLKDEEKNVLYLLVCFEMWYESEIEDLVLKCYINFDAYRRVKRLAFITKDIQSEDTANDAICSIHYEVLSILKENDFEFEHRQRQYIRYCESIIGKDFDKGFYERRFLHYVHFTIQGKRSPNVDYQFDESQVISLFNQQVDKYLRVADYAHVLKYYSVIVLHEFIKRDLLGEEESRLINNYLCLLNQTGAYREAEKFLQRIDEVVGDDIRCQFLFYKFKTLYSLGKYDDCLQVCREVEACNPELFDKVDKKHKLNIHLMFGDIYNSKGYYDGALSEYQKSLEYLLALHERQKSDAIESGLIYVSQKMRDIYKASNQPDQIKQFENLIGLLKSGK